MPKIAAICVDTSSAAAAANPVVRAAAAALAAPIVAPRSDKSVAAAAIVSGVASKSGIPHLPSVTGARDALNSHRRRALGRCGAYASLSRLISVAKKLPANSQLPSLPVKFGRGLTRRH